MGTGPAGGFEAEGEFGCYRGAALGNAGERGDVDADLAGGLGEAEGFVVGSFEEEATGVGGGATDGGEERLELLGGDGAVLFVECHGESAAVVVDHFHIIDVTVGEAEDDAPGAGDGDGEEALAIAGQGVGLVAELEDVGGVGEGIELFENGDDLGGQGWGEAAGIAFGEASGLAAGEGADGHGG